MKLFTLKRFFVVTLLMCLGISQGCAVSTTRYAPVGVGVVQSGNGKVYVSTDSPDEKAEKYQENHDGTSTEKQNKNNKYTYYRYALAKQGYVFIGWYSDEACSSFVTNENGSFQITSNKTVTYGSNEDMHTASWNSSDAIKFYAKFVSVDDYLKSVIADKTNYAEGSAENNALYELLKNNSLVTEAKNANDESCDAQTAKNKINSLEFAVLDEANGAGVQPTGPFDAVLVKRSFFGGEWNTFCIPFDITVEDLTNALGTDNGVLAKKLDKAEVKGDKYVLTFNDVDKNSDGKPYLKGGVPYIVWVNNGINKENLVLGSADVNVTVAGSTDVDYNVSFMATYDYQQLYNDDANNNCYYILYGNQFRHVASYVNVNGFRGYFKMPTEINSEALVASFDDEEITGITSVVNGNDNGDDNLYNIAGQRVNENAKGIIIKNGKKYFVK